MVSLCNAFQKCFALQPVSLTEGEQCQAFDEIQSSHFDNSFPLKPTVMFPFMWRKHYHLWHLSSNSIGTACLFASRVWNGVSFFKRAMCFNLTVPCRSQKWNTVGKCQFYSFVCLENISIKTLVIFLNGRFQTVLQHWNNSFICFTTALSLFSFFFFLNIGIAINS